MTHPKILETEKFGSRAKKAKDNLFCFECEGFIDLEAEKHIFDSFGRIFCSEECLSRGD